MEEGPRIPELSVVISTPDCYETIRKTIGHLRSQTARNRLEIVIVAPSAAKLDLDESDLSSFPEFQVITVGKLGSIARANAAGVREARAPIVAFTEDHVFPDPGWAEALIAAHRGPWAVVGPAVKNANPKSAISRAIFLIIYAPWAEPATAGEVNHLPGHNSSYKRRVLRDYGPDLESMLGAESVLHWDLRANGHTLYLEPSARVAHLNFERFSPWLRALFLTGRLFAANRARRWLLLRRLSYVGGAPLIPIIRLWRVRSRLRRTGRRPGRDSKVLPPLILGLAVSAIGEMAGYAFGAGNSERSMVKFEFHRQQGLTGRTR